METINDIFHKRFADGPVSRSRRPLGKQGSLDPSLESPATVTMGDAARARTVNINEATSGSHYETNKDLIIETYLATGQNLTATEALLKQEGIPCSRRWLSVFLASWNVRCKGR